MAEKTEKAAPSTARAEKAEKADKAARRLSRSWQVLRELVDYHTEELNEELSNWLRKDLFKEICDKTIRFELAVADGVLTKRALEDILNAIYERDHYAMEVFVGEVNQREQEIRRVATQLQKELAAQSPAEDGNPAQQPAKDPAPQPAEVGNPAKDPAPQPAEDGNPAKDPAKDPAQQPAEDGNPAEDPAEDPEIVKGGNVFGGLALPKRFLDVLARTEQRRGTNTSNPW